MCGAFLILEILQQFRSMGVKSDAGERLGIKKAISGVSFILSFSSPSS